MIRQFNHLDLSTESILVSKFNEAARINLLSVFDLYYDGSAFYKLIKEDNYYQQLIGE